MKTTRKIEGINPAVYSFEYDDFPGDGTKIATIVEWENSGEGFTITLGKDEIELTTQECSVLEILFAQTRLLK